MDYDWHFILCCCYLLNRFAHQCDCLSLLGLNVVIPDKIESFLIKACIEKFERVKRKEKKNTPHFSVVKVYSECVNIKLYFFAE